MATATPCSQPIGADSDSAVECAEAARLKCGVHVVPVKCASYFDIGPARQSSITKCCVRLALIHGTVPTNGLMYTMRAICSFCAFRVWT